MARNYAKIHTTIWSDPDFKTLTPATQHAYFLLLSQPRLSMCGLLDYIPKRLAACAMWNISDVEQQMDDLETQSYVAIDKETSELLVRSFMRNDGVLLSPNLTVAAIREYGEVVSDDLRKVLDRELIRAHREAPNLGSWLKVAEGNPVLWERIQKGSSRR